MRSGGEMQDRETALEIAEEIVRGHNDFCVGHFEPAEAWCSVAPAGKPLCDACADLAGKIADALQLATVTSPLSAPPQKPTGASRLCACGHSEDAHAMSGLTDCFASSGDGDGICQCRKFEPTGASPQAETSANVRALTVHICEDCLNLRGEMCNEPGCRFCRRTMAEVSEYLDVLLIRPRIDGVSVLVDEGTPLPAPVSPVEPTPSCVCPACDPLVDPGPTPSEDDITRLEAAAWDSETDRVLVWYRDRAEMFRQRLRETERAWQIERKQRSVEPTPEPETCEWRYSADAEWWQSGCDSQDLSGDERLVGPDEKAKFCPYCGKPLRLVPSEER